MRESERGDGPSNIGRLRQVASPRVSPDGSTARLRSGQRRPRGQPDVSRGPDGTGTDGKGHARPFSTGPDDHSPQWSPDGRWIAFTVSSEDGTSPDLPPARCATAANG